MLSQRNRRSVQVTHLPKHSNIFQNDSESNRPYLLPCMSAKLYPNLREVCLPPCAHILPLLQDMLLYKHQKLSAILAQIERLVRLLCGSVTKHHQESQTVRVPTSRNHELLALHRYPKQRREHCRNCACLENRNQ